jgi:Uma2 family endonuclease
MKTVVLGDPPDVLVSLFNERKRLGLDTHDELWCGEYHMAPSASLDHGRIGSLIDRLLGPRAEQLGFQMSLDFNVGDANNFRVPDLGVHRAPVSAVWIPTAAIVVEVRSPDDETFDKFDFYFEHQVEEVLVADLVDRTVAWYVRGTDAFVEHDRSELLGISADQVAVALHW